jgi:two-component system, LytTR family, response regulator
MLRIVIIDDEDHARETLRMLVTENCPQVSIAGEAGGVESGIKLIRETHPDLLLLDIQLTDGNSFDILARLSPVNFKVIFITAYDKYALQAFKFSAVDYLLKPVSRNELIYAINRAAQLLQQDFNLQMLALGENLKSMVGQKQRIILKTSDNIYLVEQNDIISCESDGCYTVFHTTRGEKIMVTGILKEFDELLGECGFYRIHKSYLVNLRHVIRFEKQDGGFVVLSDNRKVPVASRKRDELIHVFENMAK